ncbi:hypothetical protein J6590_081646 [Homalodisca vitripennis]|nr:hypothetical protein J6590_081646 [Homalodisca vitripennis]
MAENIADHSSEVDSLLLDSEDEEDDQPMPGPSSTRDDFVLQPVDEEAAMDELADFSSGSSDDYVPETDEEDDDDYYMSPRKRRRRHRPAKGPVGPSAAAVADPPPPDATGPAPLAPLPLLLDLCLSPPFHCCWTCASRPPCHCCWTCASRPPCLIMGRFHAIMSQFQASSRDVLPRDHPDFDPWVKVRDFIVNMNDAFKRYFVPSQEVCIDESMVGMKNRCVFIQYMPN